MKHPVGYVKEPTGDAKKGILKVNRGDRKTVPDGIENQALTSS
jgi:hypothetical protein